MTHSKVLHDLLHVLMMEQSVEARLVFAERKKKEEPSTRVLVAYLQHILKVMQNDYAGIGLTLTVQANVMEGKNDRSVSFGDSLHSTMDSAIWCLNIMLLLGKKHNENKCGTYFYNALEQTGHF